MLLFIEKLAKYTYTKEWKSARKWSVDGEVETNFYMERHAAWKKCGTRDYILNIFYPIQHFLRTPTSNMRKKIWSIRKKYKNSKLPHFYRFLLVSGSMAFPTHSLFTLQTHIPLHSFFFLFSLFLQSLPSYTHFYYTIPSFVVFENVNLKFKA